MDEDTNSRPEADRGPRQVRDAPEYSSKHQHLPENARMPALPHSIVIIISYGKNLHYKLTVLLRLNASNEELHLTNRDKNRRKHARIFESELRDNAETSRKRWNILERARTPQWTSRWIVASRAWIHPVRRMSETTEHPREG